MSTDINLILFHFLQKPKLRDSEPRRDGTNSPSSPVSPSASKRRKRKKSQTSTVNDWDSNPDLYWFGYVPVAGEGEEEEPSDFDNMEEKTELDDYQLRLGIPPDSLKQWTAVPIRWMLFLSQTIVGVLGKIAVLRRGQPQDVDLETEWEDFDGVAVYIFLPFDSEDTEYDQLANCLFSIVTWRQSGSVTQSSKRSHTFTNRIKARDLACIFTGIRAGAATDVHHIIPFVRQNAWMGKINDTHRTGIDDINDVSNGFVAQKSLHGVLGAQIAAILHTPTQNNELLPQHIPPYTVPPNRNTDSKIFPIPDRYTFQWMLFEDESALLPNNTDAAFAQLDDATFPLPSPKLLNYAYCSAVIRQFGQSNNGREVYEALCATRAPPPPTPRSTRNERDQATHEDQSTVGNEDKKNEDDEDDEEVNLKRHSNRDPAFHEPDGNSDGHAGGGGNRWDDELIPPPSQRLRREGGGSDHGADRRSQRAPQRDYSAAKAPSEVEGPGQRPWSKLNEADIEYWQTFFAVRRLGKEQLRREVQALKDEEEHRGASSLNAWREGVQISHSGDDDEVDEF